MKQLIIVLLLLLFCGVASADINVNTTGWWHDGGAFNASGTPIQHAVDNAVAGDTVYVWNGTYMEPCITITTSNIVVEGESNTVTFINDSLHNAVGFHISNTDYVTIKNLNYDLTKGITGIDLTDADHCVIEYNLNLDNCEINRAENLTFSYNTMLTVPMTTLTVVTNSTFNNNIFKGVILVYENAHNIFTSNTFNTYDSNNFAIYMCQPATNITFVNSVFLGSTTGYQLSLLSSYTDVVFKNTSFEQPTKAISSATGVPFIQTDNRVFVGTAGYTIANTTVTNLDGSGSYDYRPFWITPSTGELNITATPLWNTTDDYKKQFNITGTSGTFAYTIGDMLPNAPATISTDTWSDTKTANSIGEITGIFNGGWGDLEFTVKSITPPIINLHNKSGCFWVNHSWDNTADAYNISVNNVWYNSTNSYYFNDSYSKYEWQNISVWAYNNSMGISNICIIQNTQVSIYYPPFFLPIINLLHSIIYIFEPIPAILLVIGETLIYIAGISFIIWIVFSIVRMIMKVIK